MMICAFQPSYRCTQIGCKYDINISTTTTTIWSTTHKKKAQTHTSQLKQVNAIEENCDINRHGTVQIYSPL